MTSNQSSQTRIQPQSAFEPARVGSSQRGPIVISSGAPSTAPIDDQPTVISKGHPLGAPLAITNLAPAEMGRVLLGQRLGHYDLLEFVGGGGMGAVFKAHDTMLDRIVAVKVLSKVQSDDEETLRRFKNEAQSSARLDHDNIGRVHYVGEDRGWHYIVFEFIEGVNLRDLVLRDGPLPLAQAVSYTLQVADALAHASQRDVVHRDIKPSNVLITPEGRAKLVDMGLARLHQMAQPDQDLTASGVTLGTFDYISPEQARDPRNADVRSDLYSLGCTLYYSLTGQPPFPEGTVLQKLLQHQADDPTDARQLRPDIPDELSRVLKKLLAKAPQSRYQLPDDLVADLLAVAARYGLEVPPPSAVHRLSAIPSEAPGWVRHLPWLLPLSVLGVVVLGFALFGSVRDDGSGPPPIRRAATSEDSTSPTKHSNRTSSSDSKSPDAAASRDIGGRGTIAPASGNSTAGDAPVKVPSNGVATAGPTAIETNATVANAVDKSSAVAKSSAVPNSSDQGSIDAKPPVDSPSGSVAGSTAASSAATSIGDLFGRIRRRLDSLLSGQSTPASATMPSEKPRVPLSPKLLTLDSPTPKPPASDGDSSASAIDDGTASPGPAGAERKGVLVVDPASDSLRPSGEYATLADACRAARNGDVVEVRSNGTLRERPIDVVGLRLTIRAGAGFSPVIRFQPQLADPLLASHSMMTLAGSQMALVGLQLEFDVPRDAVAESWSLAEIRPGESLRLESCTVTVRNASDSGLALHPYVSMFDIRAVPSPGLMSPDDAPMMRPPASLQLKNCILRGEATVVRSNELQPVQVAWQNGLLATTERFLSATGGPSDPKPQGETQLELRHVTALMRGGLCRVTNSQDAPQQLPLDITAGDCIFLCDPSSALIEQSGIDSTDEFRRRLVWNGERNFYEGFTTFWRINGAGAETASQSLLHDWQAYWGSRESQPSLGKVAWQQLPPATRPVNKSIPSDFALHSGDNPPRHAASDGSDAGVQTSLLPSLGTSEPSPKQAIQPQRDDRSTDPLPPSS